MKSLKKITALFLFILMAGSTAMAQNASSEIIKEWERAKAYTKEYLDAMPDSAFSLKVTPDTRSFADQMLHIADGNYGFGTAATGQKSPVAMGSLEKGNDKSKAMVTKETLASYDFIITGLQKLTPALLQEKVKVFGQFELTKEQAVAKAFEHQTHHRGQTTMYIRLAGIKPPAEKLF
ncbi:putative damage-inducible protein DinB [Pedobacter sp. CAN_A7]|uniref:DinB family protein n=1 Tax=Pedobacter sp. CAN_A7 TaxID=2787722 RepID=UPI0018CABA77